MTVNNQLTKWVMAAALVTGLSYVGVWGAGFGPDVMTVWKGAGVALLASWAALHARNLDGWLVTAVMAFGAGGDVLLETAGLQAGAAAFAIGHIIAIILYARNRRVALSPSQKMLALLIVPAVAFIAWTLPSDRSAAIAIAGYAALLGIMAAMAWTSAFPRFRTGIGAMMFVASDLLIFARMGPIADTLTIGIAVWLLYFVGQVLIVRGVVQFGERAKS